MVSDIMGGDGVVHVSIYFLLGQKFLHGEVPLEDIGWPIGVDLI